MSEKKSEVRMTANYFKVVQYRVDCPNCGSRNWIPNPHRADLTNEEVKCDECGATIVITGCDGTFPEDL